MKFKKLFLFIIILCIAISAISAEGNDTFSSIQNEIDTAAAGDIIYLSETYYTPDSDNKEIYIDKNITIDGSSRGAGGTSTIDGKGLTNLFTIKNCTVTFLNLNFINGNTTNNGAAINAENSTTILNNCIFSDNSAYNGGAIYSDTELNISDCSFDDNIALNDGAAIYNAGNMSLSTTKFINNIVNNKQIVYLLGKNNTQISLNSNEFETKSIPIYNNNAIIVTPTTLIILNNATQNHDIGDAINLYANLYDDNNNTIGSSNPVKLQITDANINVSANFNDETQKFSANTVSLSNVGEYPVTGVYEDATDLEVLNGLLNITSIPTQITITIDDKKYSQTINGTITLNGVNGDKLTTNVTVSIFINYWNTTVPVINGVGNFVFDGILNTGDYQANVTFAGNGKYEPSTNITSFTISEIEPQMNVTVNNNKDNTEIEISLPDDIYNSVSVTIADKVYTVKIEAGKGKLVIPQLPAGNYNITVFFEGNENYLSTEKTILFNNTNNDPSNKNNSNSSKDSLNSYNTNQSNLQTGNPIALLLLALFIIPVRRALKK